MAAFILIVVVLGAVAGLIYIAADAGTEQERGAVVLEKTDARDDKAA